MQEQEWSVVQSKSKRKKRTNNNKGNKHWHRYQKHDQQHDDHPQANDDLMADWQRKFLACKQDLQGTQFYQELCSELHNVRALQNGNNGQDKQATFEAIVCLGVGTCLNAISAAATNSFFYQLALAQLIREQQAIPKQQQETALETNDNDIASAAHLIDGIDDLNLQDDGKQQNNCNSMTKKQTTMLPMYFYDPACSSPLEHKFLKDYLQIQVWTENHRGHYKVNTLFPVSSPSSPSSRILFYMPHCPLMLYHNVLWANWDHDALSRIVLLGNSLTQYTTSLRYSHEKHKVALFSTLMPFLSEYACNGAILRHDAQRCEGNPDMALNDLYLTQFQKSEAPTPPRPDCIENDDDDGELI